MQQLATAKDGLLSLFSPKSDEHLHPAVLLLSAEKLLLHQLCTK